MSTPSDAAERLDSWKAIAAYLNRDIRTVQRWECNEGLPVHRHVHGTQGSVYAYASELDAWWTGRQKRLQPQAIAPSVSRSRYAQVAYGVAAFILLVIAVWVFVGREAANELSSEPVRFTVEAPAGTTLSRFPSPAISPDGRRVVFVATSTSGTDALWIRELGSLSVRELRGTEAAAFPFWSPDSRFVGFFSHGKLTIADLTGSPTRIVCESPGSYGGTWNRDGVILFAPTHREIFRVSASGGVPTPVTTVDQLAHEIQHMWPEFLPDGRRFLYLSNGGPGRQRNVRIGSLDTSESHIVLQNASHAAYAPPNSLLFVRGESLIAQPFDLAASQVTGVPVTVATDVGVRQPIGRGAFSISQNGVLFYRTAERILSQLTLFDRGGHRLIAYEPPADHDQPRFSPDGRTAAVGMANPRGTPGRMIWLLDLARGHDARLNLGSTGSGPVWSPDGKSLAFTGRRDGPGDLYQRTVGVDGVEKTLLRSAEWKIVTDWSSDGKNLLYQQQDVKTQWDIWALNLSGAQPTPILRSVANEQHGRLSPDGRWIAYTSDETGRFEIYIRQFPPTAEVWRVSIKGGMQPEWRRDGKELFYVSGDRRLVALPLEIGVGLRLREAQPLFSLDTDGVMTTPGTFHYSVAADGQRFLVNTVVGRGTPTMTVVLNWSGASH